MTIAPERSESPSLSDSSVSDYDFSALDEAVVSGTVLDEESSDRVADAKECSTCGLPITREPGQRGRLAKYHAECKPSRTQRLTGASATKSTAANTKANREANEVIGMVKPQLFKLALALSAVDRFDAFVVLNNIEPICSSLHGILLRYDGFRRDALAMKSGGSIIGLIITGLSIALPILAHHGLIPGAKLQQALVQFPVMMFKLAQRMKEGEAALQDMMNRVSEEMLRPRNAATDQNGNGASTTAA